MRPSFSDPEAPEILADRKLRMDHHWRRGALGDAAYCLSLKCIGYLPKEAKIELNLLKMEKSN